MNEDDPFEELQRLVAELHKGPKTHLLAVARKAGLTQEDLRALQRLSKSVRRPCSCTHLRFIKPDQLSRGPVGWDKLAASEIKDGIARYVK